MIKNRLGYGMVLLAAILFLFLYTHPMTYLALYALLLLPLLSLLAMLIAKYRLTISETLDFTYAQKGKTLRYTFTVNNPSPFPLPAVRVHFQAGAGVEPDCWEAFFSVWPRKSQEAIFCVSANYRGHYTIGVGEMVLYDFLGLFSRKQTLAKTLVFTVTPQIWPIAALALNFAPHDMAQDRHRPAEDYSAISDLRTYQPTDSHKKIHWKASAKRNELISKDFLESKRQSAVFWIDNSAIHASPLEALAQEDTMMDALVSAMACCNRQGYNISLCAPGHPNTDFTDNFSDLFRSAVDLKFGDFGPFDDRFLKHASRGHGNSVNFVLIVQTLSEATCLLLRDLRQNGSHVILFYFDFLKEDSQLEALRGLGVHCLNFSDLLNG